MEQIVRSYEFVFIFFACFIMFLFISIFAKQQIIKKLSMSMTSIFLILFFFEGLLSFYLPKATMDFHKEYVNNINNGIDVYRQIEIIDSNNKEILLYEEQDLNKYKNYIKVFDATYSTYNNGFRITKGNSFSNETYIFLGCSFTFGFGVNDSETLPYYFSEKFNFENNIINCGVCGHSTNTALNILNNEIFSPLIVNKNSNIKHFFFSFFDDHVYRNFRHEIILGKENESEYASDGCLYKNNKWYAPTIIGKIKYIFATSYMFRRVFVPIIDEKFKKYYEDYMIKSLEDMNKIVEGKYNSKLTIVVWDKKRYSKYFIKKLQETKLDLIFLPEYFNFEEEGYKIKYDVHPTAKANKEIAEILYNHINEQEKIN